MPYFSYITMLTLYESLGWWRCAMDNRFCAADDVAGWLALSIFRSPSDDVAGCLALSPLSVYLLMLLDAWLSLSPPTPSLPSLCQRLSCCHCVQTLDASSSVIGWVKAFRTKDSSFYRALKHILN